MNISQLYPKLRAFVSSTYQELEDERDVIEIVTEDLNIELFRAPEKSLSGTALKAYLRELRESNIMILILAEKVSDFVDEEISTARECGIPILPFFKLIKRRDKYELSNVAKKFREKYSMGFSAEFKNLLELRDKLTKGLSNIIGARFESTTGLCGWSPSVYREAKNLITDSHWRLLLIENTSSLILGPRIGHTDELRFIEAMRKKIESIAASPSTFNFYYLFSANETLKDLGKEVYQKKDEGKAYFLKIVEKYKDDNRIKISCVPESINSSMVGDYSYGISVNIGDRLYTFGFDQHKIANELFDIGNSLFEKHKRELLKFLDKLTQ